MPMNILLYIPEVWNDELRVASGESDNAQTGYCSIREALFPFLAERGPFNRSNR